MLFHPIPINTEKMYGAFITPYTTLLSIFLKGENFHSEEMSVSILASSSITCIHVMARELSHRLTSGSAPSDPFLLHSPLMSAARCSRTCSQGDGTGGPPPS